MAQPPETRDAVKSLRVFGEGITSIEAALEGAFGANFAASTSAARHLVHLNLHCNDIERISAGINACPALTSLNLSSNRIQRLEPGGWAGVPHLTHLDLSANRLTAIPKGVFQGLEQLTTVVLAFNAIADLSGFSEPPPQLASLDLRGNRIKSLPHLTGALAHCKKLTHLSLERGTHGNPVCTRDPSAYVMRVILALPSLVLLDGVPITPQIRAEMKQAADVTNHMDANVKGASLALGAAAQRVETRTPHVDMALAMYYERRRDEERVAEKKHAEQEERIKSLEQKLEWFAAAKDTPPSAVGGRTRRTASSDSSARPRPRQQPPQPYPQRRKRRAAAPPPVAPAGLQAMGKTMEELRRSLELVLKHKQLVIDGQAQSPRAAQPRAAKREPKTIDPCPDHSLPEHLPDEMKQKIVKPANTPTADKEMKKKKAQKKKKKKDKEQSTESVVDAMAMQARVDQLAQQLATITAERDAAIQEKEAADADAKAQAQEREAKDASLHVYKKTQREAAVRVKEQAERIMSLETLLADRAGDVEAHQIAAQEQRALRESVERDRDGVREEVAALRKERDALQTRHTQAERALQEQTQMFEQLQTIFKAKVRDVQDLKQLLRSTVSKEQDVSAIAVDLRALVQRQKERLGILARDALSAQQRIATLEEELAEAVSERESLVTKLREARSHGATADTALEASHARLEELSAFKDRAAELAESLVERDDALAIKQRMLDDQNDSLSNAKAQVRTLLEEQRELYAREESLLEQRDAARGALVEKEAALAEVSRELELANERQRGWQDMVREAAQRAKEVQQLQGELDKKQDVVRYVEEEIEKMRMLFREREGAAAKEHEASRSLLQSRLEEAERERNVLMKRVEEAETSLQASESTRQELLQTCAKGDARVKSVEDEMRVLLREMHRRKRVAMQMMRVL